MLPPVIFASSGKLGLPIVAGLQGVEGGWAVLIEHRELYHARSLWCRCIVHTYLGVKAAARVGHHQRRYAAVGPVQICVTHHNRVIDGYIVRSGMRVTIDGERFGHDAHRGAGWAAEFVVVWVGMQ